jgi:hypothetical protein
MIAGVLVLSVLGGVAVAALFALLLFYFPEWLATGLSILGGLLLFGAGLKIFATVLRSRSGR